MFLLNDISKILLIILGACIITVILIYFLGRLIVKKIENNKNNNLLYIKNIYLDAIKDIEVGMSKDNIKTIFKDISPDIDNNELISYSYLIKNNNKYTGEKCDIHFNNGIVTNIKQFDITKE